MQSIKQSFGVESVSQVMESDVVLCCNVTRSECLENTSVCGILVTVCYSFVHVGDVSAAAGKRHCVCPHDTAPEDQAGHCSYADWVRTLL